MCGIVGVIYHSNILNNYSLFNYIYNMLYILQTRGYDSVGICTVSNDESFQTSKYSVDENEKRTPAFFKQYENSCCAQRVHRKRGGANRLPKEKEI